MTVSDIFFTVLRLIVLNSEEFSGSEFSRENARGEEETRSIKNNMEENGLKTKDE